MSYNGCIYVYIWMYVYILYILNNMLYIHVNLESTLLHWYVHVLLE